MALRLEKSGIETYSVITFPLSGRSSWRGRESEFPWTAKDGHLESGETFEKVLSTSGPATRFVYIDTKRQRASLPSQDISKMAVDAFVLFSSGAPMKNYCGTR